MKIINLSMVTETLRKSFRISKLKKFEVNVPEEITYCKN